MFSGLVRDDAGYLYGTAEQGGRFGMGIIFKLDPQTGEHMAYSFVNNGGGVNPVARLTRDSEGNLFGTTFNGGAFTDGTVFKLIH